MSKCLYPKNTHSLPHFNTSRCPRKAACEQRRAFQGIHHLQRWYKCIHSKDNHSFWPTSTLQGVHDMQPRTSIFIPGIPILSGPLQHVFLSQAQSFALAHFNTSSVHWLLQFHKQKEDFKGSCFLLPKLSIQASNADGILYNVSIVLKLLGL